MEASSNVGELEILVMKYVRSTCERGRTESPDIVELSGDGEEEVDEVELDETEEGDSVAGFSLACDVCILRRLDCLPLPYCATQTQQAGVVCFCTTLESAASVRCKRIAGLMMAGQTFVEGKECPEGRTKGKYITYRRPAT